MGDLLQPWHLVVLVGIIVFIVIIKKRPRVQVGPAQAQGQSPHQGDPQPVLDSTLVAPDRPEIGVSPLSDVTGTSSEKLERQRRTTNRRALVLAVGGIIIAALLVFAMSSMRRSSLGRHPLQVNPNYLVGTWNGRSRDVDITLTITSDPGPSSSSAITGTLSVSGFGAGSEGDCFNLNDGAIAGYRTADGIFLHGTVGESSEESDPENGNWRETHQYSLSAKVIPTGMSNGALKLASELLSCQRQPIAPRLTDGIGIDLSLVEAPTSTPSGQAPPAPGWDRSNAAVSTPPAPSTPPSAVLSIPVARAIKQFPPEFTASIDRVGITLTVDGRDIAEYENSTVTDLPSHDAIECSKGRMACDETVTPEPMEAEDMTAISARDGSFFAAKVLASASAIESMGHDPMTNHYKVTDWSELGPGSYRVVAEWLMDNGCGKRTITIDSLDYTASIDTSIAPACSAAYSNGSPHYPPKYETIVLSRGFSVAAAVQKSSSSNGGPGPLSPEQSAASQQMQPSDSSRNAPTVSPQGAVELGGLNARALNAKALQLLSTNPPDLNGAKLALEKAAQLDPADIEILNNLGDVYGRNGEYRSAEAVLLRVLSLAPNRRVAFGNLGSVEAKLGKTEAAANYFCQYVRRFDSLQKGKTTLARVFVDPDPNVQNAVKTTMANCMP